MRQPSAFVRSTASLARNRAKDSTASRSGAYKFRKAPDLLRAAPGRRDFLSLQSLIRASVKMPSR